jgi:hypothetical protein
VPAPSPPGFIALGHQQVLPNGLAGFARTARECLPKAANVPGGVRHIGFREPVDGMSQTLELLPRRALFS